MYINCIGSQLFSGELLGTAGLQQYLLLHKDNRSVGVSVLAGVLIPADTLLFLLYCRYSGSKWT